MKKSGHSTCFSCFCKIFVRFHVFCICILESCFYPNTALSDFLLYELIFDKVFITFEFGSGSEKTNALLNLINHQPGSDKINPNPKDSYEEKNKLLINKGESIGLNHFGDPKAVITLPA